MGIYSHTMDGNQLVQLRGCLRSFIQIYVQADPDSDNSNQIDFEVPNPHETCI
jgi:hypothetical protein